MRTLFILLITLGVLVVKAQSVFPDNGIWEQKYHSIAWGHGGVVLWDYTTYKQYSINGDSVAGGTTYLKLFFNSYFSGYITVDSLTVKYGSNADTMRILFDFGLMPGDTFVFHAPHYSQAVLQSTVESVDSVMAGGIYRKRITFADFPGYGAGPVWIEGIGDVTFGGIELDYSYVSWIGNSTHLICFIENGENIYGSCVVGIREDIAGTRLWPNPTTGPVSIDLKYTGKPILAEVYSNSGKLLLTETFNSNTGFLDLSNLKEGMYFVVTYENTNKTCRKIIKE
jgi:hypothetical protein